jgi:hypothetical protein
LSVTIGTKLGSHEITALLGKGGMGEVYRARDTKLKRDVAIKILPDEFARDADRVARFQREAEVLASLNHPNIAAIHDLDEANGSRYLVLELVEGETLADRIQRGPIPLNEALGIAKHICEALEAAHEKGIIHRDLKPANVKTTPDGKVKVLDFGLAKAMESAPTTTLSNSPTVVSMAATNGGLILGTAAYMSPEQAKGKTVDMRADIWAFGVILYEMLMGRTLFAGETSTETMAAVMLKEPDWNALPAKTPARIRELLRRCLTKDPRNRLQAIGEARIAIDANNSEEETKAVGLPNIPQHGSHLWMSIAVVAILIAGAMAVPALRYFREAPPEVRPTSRFTFPLSEGDELTTLSAGPVVALSSDGTRLVFLAGPNSGQLFLREMDGMEAKPLAGTLGASNPFFSPDGQWVGFFQGGKLKKLFANGGAALTLCDAPAGRGAFWAPDNTIYFAPITGAGISKVSASGGAPQMVTTLESKKGEITHRWPELLPGGETLLFVVETNSGADGAQIVARSLKTGEQKLLIQGGTYPHYLQSGHLVYLHMATLMAVPFDPVRLGLKGAPAPVIEGVMPTPGITGGAELTVSNTGSLVYVPGSGNQLGNNTLVWVDRKGGVQPVGAPERQYQQPQLSPDGQRLVVDSLGDIWVYDLQRGTLTRLTFQGRGNNRPFWTPDGKRIAFTADRGTGTNWFWKLADGTGPEEQLTKSQHFRNAASISPDGKIGFYTENDPKNGADIWTVQLDGERKATLFLQTPFDENVPNISPDGRWLAYLSNESGRDEIYVRAFPGPSGKWQISTDGGANPVWARSGKELFYQNGDKMMVVDIAGDAALRAGTPRMLFQGKYETVGGGRGRNYDVSPDGQRFIMIKAGSSNERSPQMIAVMNWFTELRQRVPVK